MESVRQPISVRDAAIADFREVRFRYTPNLPQLLEKLHATLLVSTYQAGKLAVIGVHDGQLDISFHNFDRPMGVATNLGTIAVGTRNQVWFLRSSPSIAPRLEPAGKFDACFLARRSHVTGEIYCHELAFGGEELWIVNSLFSCLCTIDSNHNFVPRWRPPFVSALAAEDRCHLNGLAMADGRPRYVTVLSETDEPEGWRPHKADSGSLIDVASGQTVARGFAMPHSPRIYAGKLWVLDSGRGQIVHVDPSTGRCQIVAEMPGYVRSLAIHGNVACVGLSKIRETSTFGGVPIAVQREDLRCGLAFVGLSDGATVATFEFTSGVDEVFDVTALPGVRTAAIRGPFAADDGAPAVWVVPQDNRPLGE